MDTGYRRQLLGLSLLAELELKDARVAQTWVCVRFNYVQGRYVQLKVQ